MLRTILEPLVAFIGLTARTKFYVKKVRAQKVESKVASKLKEHNLVTKFQVDQPNNGQSFHGRYQVREPPQKHGQQKISKQKTTNSPDLRVRSSNKPKDLSQTGSLKGQMQQVRQTKLQKVLGVLGKALEPIDPKKIKQLGTVQAAILQNKLIMKTVSDLKKLDLKDFSVVVHRLLVNSVNQSTTVQKFFWKQIEENFLERFTATVDPKQIRSYSKIIYCLSKSKVHRNTSSALVLTSTSTNLQSFQTKFALLLPSATHQSFSSIITSLSRMGPLSQQFAYIAQRLYYTKYGEFNVREKVQINYALTRNGRNVDSKLYQYIDSMNLNQIVTMLRCYKNSHLLDSFKVEGKSLLAFAEPHIVARKKQMNVIDIGQICCLYFQAMSEGHPIGEPLEQSLMEMYQILKRNMNEVSFEKIWKNLPGVVNRGYLHIKLVEEIIGTLKIMRRKDMFPERVWKPMTRSFASFENLQIRTKLEQIK